MRRKSYCIDLPPIPWQRTRLNGHRFYDGQAHDKVVCGISLSKQHDNDIFFDGPVHLDVIFYMPYSTNKKKNNEVYHIVRADLDNLIKFLLDCAHDILFKDDKIVCSISAKKIYDTHPRTEFTLTELEAL